MKIALFKNAGYELATPVPAGGWMEGDKIFIRISEYVDVEFPPISDGEIIQKRLDALDHAETELRTKFQDALGGIERQRQELRAITLQPAV